MATPGAYDLWSWDRCQAKISTLPGRLGFPEGKTLRFLGLEVNLEDGTVTDTIMGGKLDPPPEHLYFLLYRYAERREVPLTEKLVSFRQLPGGRLYAAVFEKRAVFPISRHLGDKPERFAIAAKYLGGQQMPQGDVAFRVLALPLVPLTYILWQATEEFPASAQVLMDSSVEKYFDAEPLTHLAALATSRLLTIALKKK